MSDNKNTQINHILRIDASARHDGSITRQLTTRTIDHLASQSAVQVKVRDLIEPLPFVTEDWMAANFTKPDERTIVQREKLALSDSLVDEIEAATTVVIGAPIYNFSVPASLKAWIDMVARVGRTFQYTENGPVGLLKGKRAIVLVASGGTQVGSEIDFATPYLQQVLKFIGITDVTFIAADALSAEADAKIAEALQTIETLN